MRRLFFLFLPVLSVQADQLVLKNGDRVTGAIVKKDDKSITIKSEAFGEITAPWDKIESLTADKPLTIVLKDGKTVEGTLASAGPKVEVATKDTKLSVDPADLQVLRNADEQKAYERMLRPSLTQLWAATANLGFAGAVGNASTRTLATSATFTRVTRTDKTTVTFSAIGSSAVVNHVSSETARAVRGGVAYDHNISSRFFVGVFNNDEYDRFQDLDLRFVAGGGLGVHAVKSERSKLDFRVGGDYNHESFSTSTRSSGEFFWGDDYTLQLTKSVSLVQGFRMFNNLSNTGEYRINFDFGITAKLTKWLNWNGSASDRYLSNPLPGNKTNDFIYTTGIGVKFP